jgi:flagellar basal body-associated protein FliL
MFNSKKDKKNKAEEDENNKKGTEGEEDIKLDEGAEEESEAAKVKAGGKEEGAGKDPDYKKEVNDNIVIHRMPTNLDAVKKKDGNISGFDTGVESADQEARKKSAKMAGVIIMVSGLIILIGGSYLGYIFMVKPYLNPSDNKGRVVSEEEKEEGEVDDKEQAEEEEVRDDEEDKEDEKVATTTPTTTPEEIAATTTPTTTVVDVSPATTTPTTTDEEIAATTTPTTTIISLGEDTDRDGLTNREEELLGTDIRSADTDEDGYGDAEEVSNLYDPAGAGKIGGNPGIDEFIHPDYGYSLYHPASWKSYSIDSDRTKMFRSEDNTIITIVYQPNNKGLELESWYREQFNMEEDEKIEAEPLEGEGWQALANKDSKTFYLMSAESGDVYTLSLTFGSDNENNYPNIFRLAVDSFGFN